MGLIYKHNARDKEKIIVSLLLEFFKRMHVQITFMNLSNPWLTRTLLQFYYLKTRFLLFFISLITKFSWY